LDASVRQEVDSIGQLRTEYAAESIQFLPETGLGQARINDHAHGLALRRLAIDEVGEC
jgi:hypothetical protein